MAETSQRKASHRNKIADPGTTINQDETLPEYAGQRQTQGSESQNIVNQVIHGPGDSADPGDESSPETDSDAK